MLTAAGNVIDFTAHRNALRGGSTPAAITADMPLSRATVILQLLSSRASEKAADPGVVAHPDHELLGLCAHIVMLRNREEELWAMWQNTQFSGRGQQDYWVERKAITALMRKPLLRAGKLNATTIDGLYAKAVAVRLTGPTGVMLGKSLATDLLASDKLRAVLSTATAT